MSFDPQAFGICAIAAGAAVATFCVERARYRRWISTTGTIVEIVRREIRTSDREYTVLRPRVRFRIASGETAAFVASISWSSRSVGKMVPVLYDPADPRSATTAGFVSRHMPEIVVFTVGMTGVFLYVYERLA